MWKLFSRYTMQMMAKRKKSLNGKVPYFAIFFSAWVVLVALIMKTCSTLLETAFMDRWNVPEFRWWFLVYSPIFSSKNFWLFLVFAIGIWVSLSLVISWIKPRKRVCSIDSSALISSEACKPLHWWLNHLVRWPWNLGITNWNFFYSCRH